jgi:predicted nucleotidyltransferase
VTDVEELRAAVRQAAIQAAGVLAEDRPRAVVLFGSAAAFLDGREGSEAPHDLDLLLVGDFPPPQRLPEDHRFPVELHRLRIAELIEIATILRYDARLVALARLYADNVMRQHALRVIAACLLLGPAYGDFGFEQIEVEGRPDPRDYSCQRVLYGQRWWGRIAAWARERRGPMRRWSDRLVDNDAFPG